MLMGNYYGVRINLGAVLEGVRYIVSLGTLLNYRSGVLPFHKNIYPKNYAPIVARDSDVTICVVGLTADKEGEEVDAIASQDIGDKVDLKLPENKIHYIKALAKHKKGPIFLEDVEDDCNAISQIWYLGEQGGNAVARVLFGDVSPSCHLPITFPKKSIAQRPAYDDYSMQCRTYKYMTEEPIFLFCFGLTCRSTGFKTSL